MYRKAMAMHVAAGRAATTKRDDEQTAESGKAADLCRFGREAWPEGHSGVKAYLHQRVTLLQRPEDVAKLGWHGLDGDRRLAFRRMDDRSGFPWLTAS